MRDSPEIIGSPSARILELEKRLSDVDDALDDWIAEYGCECVPPHDGEGSSGPTCESAGHVACHGHRIESALHRKLLVKP